MLGSKSRNSSASCALYSVVIPHYTNAERTIKLVQDIVQTSKYLATPLDGPDGPLGRELTPILEVIVIDDASPDGSGNAIKFAFDNPEFDFKAAIASVIFKSNNENRGFSRTVNRGASVATGKTLVICNTDICFIDSCPFSTILTALSAALEDNKIGSVMPLIYNVSKGEVENLCELNPRYGLLWHSKLKETNAMSKSVASLIDSKHQQASVRDSAACEKGVFLDVVLCGAFFAMRRIDFLEIGGFNPVFHPYYWEDVELGVRINERGQRNVVLSNLLVMHNHDGSIGTSVSEAKRLRVASENQLRFARMHGDSFGLTNMPFWHLLRGLRSALKGDFYMAKRYLSS